MQIRPSASTGAYEQVPDEAKMLPWAAHDEVKLGKAQFYTVLEGEQIEAFDIEITALHPNTQDDMKGIEFRVTDSLPAQGERRDHPGHERFSDRAGWQDRRRGDPCRDLFPRSRIRRFRRMDAAAHPIFLKNDQNRPFFGKKTQIACRASLMIRFPMKS